VDSHFDIMSLATLADVEVHMVMRFLDVRSLLVFARCDTRMLKEASRSFAWYLGTLLHVTDNQVSALARSALLQYSAVHIKLEKLPLDELRLVKRCRKLTVERGPISSEQTLEFLHLPFLARLIELDVRFPMVDAFEQLPNFCPMLESATVSYQNGRTWCKGILSLPRLRSLHIHACSVWMDLEPDTHMSPLQSIHLSHISEAENICDMLTSIGQQSRTTSVVLGHSPKHWGVSKGNWKSALSCLPFLSQLQLEECLEEHEPLTALAACPELAPCLRMLVVSTRLLLNSESIDAIASILRTRSSLAVDIRCSYVVSEHKSQRSPKEESCFGRLRGLASAHPSGLQLHIPPCASSVEQAWMVNMDACPKDTSFLSGKTNLYPSELVGMDMCNIIQSSDNVRSYVRMFLDHHMIRVVDGMLCMSDARDKTSDNPDWFRTDCEF
jgi:hypothetical protein